jgi:hypothetical protein
MTGSASPGMTTRARLACTTVTTTVDRQSHRSPGRSLPRAVT